MLVAMPIPKPLAPRPNDVKKPATRDCIPPNAELTCACAWLAPRVIALMPDVKPCASSVAWVLHLPIDVLIRQCFQSPLLLRLALDEGVRLGRVAGRQTLIELLPFVRVEVEPHHDLVKPPPGPRLDE